MALCVALIVIVIVIVIVPLTWTLTVTVTVTLNMVLAAPWVAANSLLVQALLAFRVAISLQDGIIPRYISFLERWCRCGILYSHLLSNDRVEKVWRRLRSHTVGNVELHQLGFSFLDLSLFAVRGRFLSTWHQGTSLLSGIPEQVFSIATVRRPDRVPQVVLTVLVEADLAPVEFAVSSTAARTCWMEHVPLVYSVTADYLTTGTGQSAINSFITTFC